MKKFLVLLIIIFAIISYGYEIFEGLQVDGDITPDTTSIRDLGSSSLRFSRLYIDTIKGYVFLDSTLNIVYTIGDSFYFENGTVGYLTIEGWVMGADSINAERLNGTADNSDSLGGTPADSFVKTDTLGALVDTTDLNDTLAVLMRISEMDTFVTDNILSDSFDNYWSVAVVWDTIGDTLAFHWDSTKTKQVIEDSLDGYYDIASINDTLAVLRQEKKIDYDATFTVSASGDAMFTSIQDALDSASTASMDTLSIIVYGILGYDSILMPSNIIFLALTGGNGVGDQTYIGNSVLEIETGDSLDLYVTNLYEYRIRCDGGHLPTYFQTASRCRGIWNLTENDTTFVEIYGNYCEIMNMRNWWGGMFNTSFQDSIMLDSIVRAVDYATIIGNCLDGQRDLYIDRAVYYGVNPEEMIYSSLNSAFDGLRIGTYTNYIEIFDDDSLDFNGSFLKGISNITGSNSYLSGFNGLTTDTIWIGGTAEQNRITYDGSTYLKIKYLALPASGVFNFSEASSYLIGKNIYNQNYINYSGEPFTINYGYNDNDSIVFYMGDFTSVTDTFLTIDKHGNGRIKDNTIIDSSLTVGGGTAIEKIYSANDTVFCIMNSGADTFYMLKK